MKNISFNGPFFTNGLAFLHDKIFLEKQRFAGKVVANCLTHLEQRVKEKTQLTLKQLSQEAEQIILENNCIPTFKNYKGFPESVCISINKQLVHGVPTDYKLQEGDLVSFDLGATYDNAIADSAITCIYGDPKSEKDIKLIKITEECLYKAIDSIKIGNKIGCIGNTIYKHAKNNGFNVIDNYGGHGIGLNNKGEGIAHAFPFVSNKNEIDEGIRIQPGLSIAIEPLLTYGNNKTKTLNDEWTVVTENNNCHWEHTLFIHEDKVEIITLREKI